MSSQTQAIDWLFSHATNGRGALAAALTAEGLPPTAPSPAEVGALKEVQPPPPLRGPDDLKAAYEWLQRERGRLEAYTAAHLARLRSQHQAALAQSSLNEQAQILRAQDLNRQEEMLLAAGRAVQQQAASLSEREKALSAELERWWRAHEELAAVQEASASARQETDEQRALADALRNETAALQQARQGAQTELQALAVGVEEQRQARGREEALRATRQAHLEQRLVAVDLAEEALQRRLAEVDEVEARLRQELEAQEEELARQRRELEALWARQRPQPRVGEWAAGRSAVSHQTNGV